MKGQHAVGKFLPSGMCNEQIPRKKRNTESKKLYPLENANEILAANIKRIFHFLFLTLFKLTKLLKLSLPL